MAFCSNCGRPLDDSDKFCRVCGKAKPNNKKTQKANTNNLDIAVDACVVLKGTKDEKTEVLVFVPELNRTVRVLVPNFVEEGQRIRIHGAGLAGSSGQKGDLYVNLSKVECYDVELTTSVTLSGNADAATKVFVYLPHTKSTVQVSVPNSTTTDQTLRLKGLGLDAPNGEPGDVYLHFNHIEYAAEPVAVETSAQTKARAESQSKETSNVKQCPTCLKTVPAHSAFCLECGAPISDTANANQAERKIVYDGVIHKCPNCGELVNSFTLNCPLCGHEFRGSNTNNAVQKLAKKLEEIEANRPPKKARTFKDEFFGTYGNFSKEDEQKINLIRNFVIPNTKEDILEFMILAASNIDMKLYGTEASADETGAQRAISDAWMAKFEQAYQKAQFSFAETSVFAKIQKIHVEKMKEVTKEKRKKTGELLLIVGGIVIMMIFLLVALAFVS